MKRLAREIETLTNFVQESIKPCPAWTSVLFIENLSQYRRPGGFYKVPRAAVLAPEAFEPTFNSLLNECTWINFQAAGVANDTLIINVDYPRDRFKHGRPGNVAVNLSGPNYLSNDGNETEVDLSGKLEFTD